MRGPFDAGKFVDIIGGFPRIGLIGVTVEDTNVPKHERGQREGVECVKESKIGWPIKEERVHIEVGDVCLDEHTS